MKIPVLDHGYVEFIEAWGAGKSFTAFESDTGKDFEKGIIEAARQSTQGSFRGWDSDAKLLKYLYDNQHNTPFEFSGMVIEVQAPIFVFREWHRHRTQSYNEMSARYEPLPDLYYIPDTDNVLQRALNGRTSANKQAGIVRGGVDLSDHALCSKWTDALNKFYNQAELFYKESLALGIPKELARLSMPVGHYSRMRASANLRNWLAFLTLRSDEKAQWEIRQFAQAVDQIISQIFPRTHQLFVDRRLRAG